MPTQGLGRTSCPPHRKNCIFFDLEVPWSLNISPDFRELVSNLTVIFILENKERQNKI